MVDKEIVWVLRWWMRGVKVLDGKMVEVLKWWMGTWL